MMSLVKALETEASSSGLCMCAGTLRMHFVGGSNRVIALHHGTSLRWSLDDGNYVLTNPDAIMDWLSERGITFVRDEHEAALRRAEESEREAERWYAILPASLREFFPAMKDLKTTDPEWTAALEREFPDPVERTKELLALFGRGMGAWSGYPLWEKVPEEILINYPLEVLFSAIRQAESPAIYEGALRLFCSWSFGKRRRKLRKRIPPDLRQVLLTYAGAHRSASVGEVTRALTQRAQKRQDLDEVAPTERVDRTTQEGDAS